MTPTASSTGLPLSTRSSTVFVTACVFQNALGGWQDITYECDFNTVTGAVLDVRARPGLIP